MVSQALKRFGVISLLCLSMAFCIGNVAQGESDARLKKQMQRKLRNTKHLMAGLALDDWSRIEQGTQGLLSTCEALGWTGAAKEEFEMRDKAFHMAVKRLQRFVDAKNGDGARLQFIQLVMLCMDCHNLPKE
ncbi:MAG: hypothetical protein ACE5IC_04955 [Candidatus Brocadiales bacterium]